MAENNPQKTEVPRELILKLGQKITDRIGHKVTADDPEYWGLACVVTDEMAEVALKMKVRKPMTLAQLVKATGKDAESLEKLLYEMSVIGILEYNWENPAHEKQYVLPMFVPGSAEFTNMNRQQLQKHPELARFFERMSRLPLEKVTPMVPPGGAGIGMHVIPVEKAIEMENQSVNVEHISHWLKKYDGKYAASPCSCRMSRCVLGEGCADDPEDCVACGRCVEYCPAGAVKLGQKLCTKEGPVIYPQQELPDAVKWGPEKWDEDYRDNNRINCYDAGTAPCKTACPAHIAVQGYLKMAAQGRYRDALALIKKENPFPAVCGRVCNRRCEDACTRGTIDQAVAIDEVKKFIAQQDLNAENRYIPPIVQPSNRGLFTEKIAIIGAGPAGLSCAYYLAEKGYQPTVFEKNKRPGGMLVYGIPSYKLEKNVVDAEIEVLREMGVEIRCGVEVGKDLTIDELRRQGYKAFYIAIGCQGGRMAGIPGEEADGVMTAVDFLRKVGEQEAYPVQGRAVVIGGGNVAIDVARTAGRCGAESVSMYCLEPRDAMPASQEEIFEAEDEGVQIHCGWGPKEICTEDGKVTGIVLKKCVSVFDAEGSFCPVYDEADTVTVPCEHVFLSIGQSILWGDLLQGSKVELGRGQGAVADPVTYQTAEPDLFVGGDVYTGPKFAIDAIAAGKEGAISIHRFVQPNSSLTIGRNRRQFIELDKGNLQVETYDNSARQIAGMEESIDYRKSFRDAHKTFTEEQVKLETARCLSCGASVVDPNKCIGCGVCTTKCEFDAIHLYREHPECSKMMKAEDKMKGILPYMLKREFKIRFTKKEQ